MSPKTNEQLGTCIFDFGIHKIPHTNCGQRSWSPTEQAPVEAGKAAEKDEDWHQYDPKTSGALCGHPDPYQATRGMYIVTCPKCLELKSKSAEPAEPSVSLEEMTEACLKHWPAFNVITVGRNHERWAAYSHMKMASDTLLGCGDTKADAIRDAYAKLPKPDPAQERGELPPTVTINNTLCFTCMQFHGARPCAVALAKKVDALEAELAAVRAKPGQPEVWSEAVAEMRDAILNERYGLAEAGAGSDVINAVLGIIDDLTPASTPNQDGDNVAQAIAELAALRAKPEQSLLAAMKSAWDLIDQGSEIRAKKILGMAIDKFQATKPEPQQEGASLDGFDDWWQSTKFPDLPGVRAAWPGGPVFEPVEEPVSAARRAWLAARATPSKTAGGE